MKSTADWVIRHEPARNLEGIGAAWRDLESRAESSFFQRWGWIGNWVRSLPGEDRPDLLRVERDGRIVGLAMLGSRNTVRRRVIRSKILYVSETGTPDRDAITVEHNGLLIESGLEAEVLSRWLDWLVRSPLVWDEIRVSGLDESRLGTYLDACARAGLDGRVERVKPYFLVDLDKVRRAGGDLLQTLSRNSRYQLRRALREHGQGDGVAVRPARTLPEALEMFGRLRALHQQYWQARGEPGAFGTPFALGFHESLIRDRFASDEIQLLEVSAARGPFGYLYNFVGDDVVLNYQGGFAYEDDPKLKPGLVSHYQAVQFNLSRGKRCYDFLMGDHRYKRSLSTDEERMVWLVIQRRRLRFRVENLLRALRERLRSAG